MTIEKTDWVISVKLGKGCYRHLQVPKSSTLADLADSILWSFQFDNDHAHAFFMDNRLWSDDAYYMKEVDFENNYPHTDENRLKEVLTLRQDFKFLFDFGDCWKFQCKVLREVEGEGETYLIRSVGEAPAQYDYFD